MANRVELTPYHKVHTRKDRSGLSEAYCVRFDFVKFAQAHRIDYATDGHHHTHAGWVQTHCPLCTDGRHGYHLGFSLAKGNANCWRCGPIKLTDALRGLVRGLTLERALELIRKYGGGRGPEEPPASRRTKEATSPPGLGPIGKQHLKYLHGRGLPASCVEEWELQGTRHLSGLWNWRVCFPVKNQIGDVVAWGGRSIFDDAKPKYKMADDEDCAEDPKTLLYGIHRVPGDSILVVEGPSGVWNIGPGATATLGIDWRMPQALMLRRFKRRFIMFDPEPRAQKKAQELAEFVSGFPGETEIIDDIPTDPGALPRRLVHTLRRLLLKED